MPSLLHTADVHLGARHQDLGPAAVAQRERQFAAFRKSIDAALDRDVDAFLICGDLFDSNAQPRRTVERAARELRRLADRGIPSVLIPGTHDCYDQTSIYRTFNLAELAGLASDSDLIVVLTPERQDVALEHVNLVVHGRVFDTKKAPRSPLAGFSVQGDRRGRWHVGMIHGSMAIPGQPRPDDVQFTADEVARSGLDYLALGHWHSRLDGKAGNTVWAYSGAPEAVAVDQDGAGQVLLVTLAEPPTGVQLEPITVGQTTFKSIEIDAATLGSQDELATQLRALANPDLVLEVLLGGVAPDTLEINPDEVEKELDGSFLRLRFSDRSVPALPQGPLPPTDTIPGAFIRDLEARIRTAEEAGDDAAAAEAREVLRYGRLLLEDARQVTLV